VSDDHPKRGAMSLDEATISNMWEIIDPLNEELINESYLSFDLEELLKEMEVRVPKGTTHKEEGHYGQIKYTIVAKQK